MSIHIKQRGKADCGIAAIAMFTGLPYETVYKAGIESDHFKPKYGTYEASKILEHLGFHYDNLGRSAGIEPRNPNGKKFQYIWLPYSGVASKFVAKLLWGRKALVSIESLNNPGGLHFVYFDGKRVRDPQEGRRGKKFAVSLDKVEIEKLYIWEDE